MVRRGPTILTRKQVGTRKYICFARFFSAGCIFGCASVIAGNQWNTLQPMSVARVPVLISVYNTDLAGERNSPDPADDSENSAEVPASGQEGTLRDKQR
eukprot:3757409-Rhodomonas_salina.1